MILIQVGNARLLGSLAMSLAGIPSWAFPTSCPRETPCSPGPISEQGAQELGSPPSQP